MLHAIHESNQNINLYNNRKDSIKDNHIDNDEQTRSDEQMLIIRGVGVEPGYLYSWLRRFDAARGVKTPVLGFCRFDTGTLEVRVLIVDDEKAIQGVNVPVFWTFWTLASPSIHGSCDLKNYAFERPPN
jgi:hypothetical protein